MKAKLVSIQDVSFQDRNNEAVMGVKLHILYRQADVAGLATSALWFPSDNIFYKLVSGSPVGCTLDLEYGPKNKLVDVNVLRDVVLDLELNPVSPSTYQAAAGTSQPTTGIGSQPAAADETAKTKKSA